LVKVRRGPIVCRRDVQLLKVQEAWLAAVLANADVMSEGSTVEEEGGAVYYGSTSIRCHLDVGALTTAMGEQLEPEALAHAVVVDPHTRLRLVRLAHREAVVRAGGPLNVMYAELSAQVLDSERSDDAVIALAFDVDLSAALARLQKRAGSAD